MRNGVIRTFVSAHEKEVGIKVDWVYETLRQRTVEDGFTEYRNKSISDQR